ncbi:hypothetical protein AGABI2DRAFT_178038 [Agaricus bisporus var. bisporus H97]|uniref:hypothetical protein n=1 Tax=Agaricus bisporus var. bisporus (strain H97 / ATCC MYA-4626 / FGSC 10389) TaxID=936046 RepID=UPI00029F7CEE|nr:hypothetical protein AGABI2DRAFT_178038 [Agaricus bisporus var. bisporus H97]EKV48642.1 hypothetical protein AGABI2DRAFT_178038 [Agaricus bisporus var. bisporus H97]
MFLPTATLKQAMGATAVGKVDDTGGTGQPQPSGACSEGYQGDISDDESTGIGGYQSEMSEQEDLAREDVDNCSYNEEADNGHDGPEEADGDGNGYDGGNEVDDGYDADNESELNYRHTAKMAQATDLPIELIDLIFSFLPPNHAEQVQWRRAAVAIGKEPRPDGWRLEDRSIGETLDVAAME